MSEVPTLEEGQSQRVDLRNMLTGEEYGKMSNYSQQALTSMSNTIRALVKVVAEVHDQVDNWQAKAELAETQLCYARSRNDDNGYTLEELAQARLDERERACAPLLARIEELEAEVSSRYTAAQVGDFQASEAGLVAEPLKREIQDLKSQLRNARDRAGQAESEVKDLTSELRNQSKYLRTASTVRAKVADLLNGSEVARLLELSAQEPTNTPAGYLAGVIRDVRWIMSAQAWMEITEGNTTGGQSE